MTMKPKPETCLGCDAPWSQTVKCLARGLCRRCYSWNHANGNLDKYPKYKYASTKTPKPKQPWIEATCNSEGCTATIMRQKRYHHLYRCYSCTHVKKTYGVYDKTLLARYDSTLPPKERVAFWLNPKNKSYFKGELTPFVKRGGPDGTCLVWQRRTNGSTSQRNSDKGLYPQVHFCDGSTSYTAQRAHRVVYSVMHNIPLSNLLVVDHRCGVRTCINPDHLGHETYASNTAGAIMGIRKDKEIAELKKEIKKLKQQLKKQSLSN